jgi:hypothetical protein
MHTWNEIFRQRNREAKLMRYGQAHSYFPSSRRCNSRYCINMRDKQTVKSAVLFPVLMYDYYLFGKWFSRKGRWRRSAHKRSHYIMIRRGHHHIYYNLGT